MTISNANHFSADSYLGGSRPNRQSLCYWQWRYACTDLEVSFSFLRQFDSCLLSWKHVLIRF